jgi:hypothetical protein
MSWVYRPGHPAANENGMVPRDLAGEPVAARSALPGPMVISDAVEVKSMVDGAIYTSKSALRRSYRERGYVEVGNEEMKPRPKPRADRKGIKAAVRRAASQVGLGA